MKPADEKALGATGAILIDLGQEVVGLADYYFEDEVAREIEVTVSHLRRIADNLEHLCAALRNPQANTSGDSE